MSPRKANIIAYSVFIIIAVLIGLGSWGVIRGPGYKSVAICIIFVAVGSSFLYSVYSAIRRGMISVGVKGSDTTYTYSRQSNPVAFWFFIVLILTIVLAAYSVGAYVLFHSPTH